MHICLPDTRELRPSHGPAFVLYNVHIDGLYHCSLRYKQLLHLHQALSKKFTSPLSRLPPFPPKKLLPLSTNQIEERRSLLEKYLQNISQDKIISNSPIFNLFLLEAQRESTKIKEKQVYLDIELVNGQKIRLQILAHDSADSVLKNVCRALGLNSRTLAYFCLCLCGYDVIRDKLIIKRRLSFFESPYITLQMAIQQQEQLHNVLSNHSTILSGNYDSDACRCLSCSAGHRRNQFNVPYMGSSSSTCSSFQPSGEHQNSNNNNDNSLVDSYHQFDESRFSNGDREPICYAGDNICNNQNGTCRTLTTTRRDLSSSFVTHRILLKKAYWDPIYDTYILNDQQALNLLFIQTVYDMKHSLMFADRDTYHQLEALLASDSKLEYILLARKLKYYNYVHFEPCLSDYPRPGTKVMISIGSKELNMRVLKTSNKPQSEEISPIASSNNQSLVNGVDGQNVLYCTSSLVQNGYNNLVAKDDIIGEEYSFKVPLIRCWRLTSLETLNSNNSNVNQSPIGNCKQLENCAKRKSLSLFNSVVGNSQPTHALPTNTNININTSNTNLINNGNINGNALSTSNNLDNFTNENRQNEQQQRSVTRNGSSFTSLLASLTQSYSNNHSHSPIDNNYTCHNCTAYPTNGCRFDHNMRNAAVATNDGTQFSQYELSFEYLVSKDKLQWITISSDQAIFISVSLQGVVDELVSKREAHPSYHRNPDPSDLGLYAGIPRQQTSAKPMISNVNLAGQNLTYMYRDGTQKPLNPCSLKLIDKLSSSPCRIQMSSSSMTMMRRNSQLRHSGNDRPVSSSSISSFGNNSTNTRASTSSNWQPARHSPSSHRSGVAGGGLEILNFKKAPNPIINDAFEGLYNDEDL